MTCADLIAEARHHGADVVLDGSGRPVVRCARPLPDDLMARLRDHRDEMVRWLRIEVELGLDLAGMVAEVVEDRDELDEAGLLPKSLLPGIGLPDVLIEHRRRHGPASLERLARKPLTEAERYLPPGADAVVEPARVVDELSKANLEWRRHRAERERIQLAKLRGELLDRQEAIAMMAGWVRTFARGVLAVEGRVAHALNETQRELIRNELRALLEALSRAGSTLG